MAGEHLLTVESSFSHKETVKRLEAAIRERGMTSFAHIDHAAGAAEAGLSLRPTELLIFGSPKTGTALMQDDQRIGIDLPLRALVWQDGSDRTWVSCIDPVELAKAYEISNRDDLLAKMKQALVGAVKQATTH